MTPHARGREALIAQERLYRQAVALCPSHAVAHNNLGQVYEHLGRYAEAIAEYTKATALRSNEPYPYFGLGDVYFKQGNYQEALKWYDAGLARDPTDASAQDFRLQAEALLQRRVIPAAQIAQVLGRPPSETRGSAEAVKLTWGTGLLPFTPAQSALRAEAHAQLDEAGSALVAPPLAGYIFEIGGHTDRRESAEAARELSLRRAQAVKTYLMTHFRIPGERLQVKGHGADHLMVLGDDEAAQALNNRVELVRVGKVKP